MMPFSDHPSPSIIPERLQLLAVRCDSVVLCLLVASKSTLSRPWSGLRRGANSPPFVFVLGGAAVTALPEWKVYEM
jgi:hypothetical protein